MTINTLRKMTFEDAICQLAEENYCITSFDTLKEYAIEKLIDDNVGLALFIISAIFTQEGEWFDYDYSMGTLEKPTPLIAIEDLERYCEVDYATF